MLDASILVHRIQTAEDYLQLLRVDRSGVRWELERDDSIARNDLPLALALIHPENWPPQIARDKMLGPRMFRTAELFLTRMCSAAEYWGVACNSDTLAEGAVADHCWPYSLGGPTEVSNIRWLCRTHNAAKTADVHLFPWEDFWPDWLGNQLDRVGRTRALHGLA